MIINKFFTDNIPKYISKNLMIDYCKTKDENFMDYLRKGIKYKKGILQWQILQCIKA